MFLLNPDTDPACVSAATGRLLQLPHPSVDPPLTLPNSVFLQPLASCCLPPLTPACCCPAGEAAASSGPSSYHLFGTATVGVDRDSFSAGRGQRPGLTHRRGAADRHAVSGGVRRFRWRPPLIDATGRHLSLRSGNAAARGSSQHRFRSLRRNLASTVAVSAAAPPPAPLMPPQPPPPPPTPPLPPPPPVTPCRRVV